MGQVVTGVIGGAVGFVVSGFNPMGAMYGAQLGFMAGALIFAKDQVVQGAKIGDVTKQHSQEGVPRPIVFGNGRMIGGNVIYSGKPRIKIIRTKVSGGKGGSSQYQESEEVYRTYAIRICEGPITGVRRVWENNKLVYDARPEKQSETRQKNNAHFLKTARFYMGTYQQMPDSALQSEFGVNNVPAHRGTCYMVIDNKELTAHRGAIPQYQFEVGTGQPLQIAVAGASDFGSGYTTHYEVYNDIAYSPDPAYPPLGNASFVDFSPDNKLLAVGQSQQPRLSVLDVSTKQVVNPHPDLPNTATQVRFQPTGDYLALICSATNNGLFVFRVDDWAKTALGAELGAPRALAWSPDGRYLAVGHTAAPYFTIFDSRTWEKLEGVYQPNSTIFGIGWKYDGSEIAIGGIGPAVSIPVFESTKEQAWTNLRFGSWEHLPGTVTLDGDIIVDVVHIARQPTPHDHISFCMGTSGSGFHKVLRQGVSGQWMPRMSSATPGLVVNFDGHPLTYWSRDGRVLAINYGTQPYEAADDPGGMRLVAYDPEKDTFHKIEGFSRDPATALRSQCTAFMR